ncbi:hypothetical protein Tsubulata_029281 [Turnera subulata]|uniref:Cytochrome P450 n=1 Tax=Turnera subulata TaxID=218843 RepID=A0A9Q0GKF0_9ROSI|nr:hypothetical protein Tsubulata_029281 [Turnera subulata]
MALLILLLALPLFLFLFKKYKSSKEVRLPPGPKGLPLIGNLHQLDSSNPQKYLWELSKKYGPLMFLRLGFKPTLVVSSAKMAKEVLKTYDLEFCSRPLLTAPTKLSYNRLDIIFAPYDAYWREMRKISVVHLFNSNQVQSFRPIREEEVRLLIGNISESASASKPFNLTEAMISCTSNIVCRVAFGKKLYEDGGSERTRFQELLNESESIFAIFFPSDYFPYMGWADKITGLAARLEKNFKEFDVLYQEIIDEHLDPKRPKPAQEDIVDILLQMLQDRSFQVQLTFDHIKAILMV